MRGRPATELGCQYFSVRRGDFTLPTPDATLEAQCLVVHYGAPGGVLPKLTEAALAPEDVDGSADDPLPR